jgi:hypothetical protein
LTCCLYSIDDILKSISHQLFVCTLQTEAWQGLISLLSSEPQPLTAKPAAPISATKAVQTVQRLSSSGALATAAGRQLAQQLALHRLEQFTAAQTAPAFWSTLQAACTAFAAAERTAAGAVASNPFWWGQPAEYTAADAAAAAAQKSEALQAVAAAVVRLAQLFAGQQALVRALDSAVATVAAADVAATGESSSASLAKDQVRPVIEYLALQFLNKTVIISQLRFWCAL